MKTKVTRRGDRWTFCLEARVALQYVLEDPEEDARVVMGKMNKIAQAAFDEALAKGECRRNGDVSSLLVWDKNDQYSAGHPWAEPDPRDDFPGFCCWPDCDQKSLYSKPVCREHLKHVCEDCGWVMLPGSGCKCFKNDQQVEIELKKRHPRKPLDITPCEHSPVEGKTDCAACRISRAGLPTPCDEVASEYQKMMDDVYSVKVCKNCGMPYRTTCWKCGEAK